MLNMHRLDDEQLEALLERLETMSWMITAIAR
jgi:hypothetical protein